MAKRCQVKRKWLLPGREKQYGNLKTDCDTNFEHHVGVDVVICNNAHNEICAFDGLGYCFDYRGPMRRSVRPRPLDVDIIEYALKCSEFDAVFCANETSAGHVPSESRSEERRVG